jgi:uncharacterized membrane protein YphA (DoxX/SURF4 family)
MGNAQVVALLLLRLVVGITMIAHGTNHWMAAAASKAPPAGSPARPAVRPAAGVDERGHRDRRGSARDVLAAAAEEGRGGRRASRAGPRLEQ